MTKIEKVTSGDRLANRMLAVALGSMMLLPAGYLLPANAADTNSALAMTGTATDESIRPFQFHVPQAQLDDLRRRISRKPAGRTRRQSMTTPRVSNWRGFRSWFAIGAPTTTGVRLRPSSMPCRNSSRRSTRVDIQFIHVKSRHPRCLATSSDSWMARFDVRIHQGHRASYRSTAYGGRPEDAFDVIIPSIPGHGFSGKPTELGWGPNRTARAWDMLVKRLGYTKYVSQRRRPRLSHLRCTGPPGAQRPARHPFEHAGDHSRQPGKSHQ